MKTPKSFLRWAMAVVALLAIAVVGTVTLDNLGTGGFVAPRPPTAETETSAVIEQPICTVERGSVVAGLQKLRADKELPAFIEDDALNTIAVQKIDDMVANKSYGENYSDGSIWYQNIRNAGVNAKIGYYYSASDLTTDAVVASFGDVSYLSDASYTRFGVDARCTDYVMTKNTGGDVADQYMNKTISSLAVIYFAQDEPPAVTPKYRIGAICMDGSRSSATGSGACSYHGGVREWLYND